MLLQSGREKALAGDFDGAERKFRICNARLSNFPQRNTSRDFEFKLEVLESLFSIYTRPEVKGDRSSASNAKLMLLEKITVKQRWFGKEDSQISADWLDMAMLLHSQNEYIEAQLYARRVLNRYRKMGITSTDGVHQCLTLLVESCTTEGKPDEAEAYSTMLSVFGARSRRDTDSPRQKENSISN